MATGTVKWWNSDSGYGFLAVDGEEDVFIQRSAVADPAGELKKGDTVSFTPMRGNFGRIAADARRQAREDDPQLEL